MKEKPFKPCPNCGMIWSTLEDFLDDPDLHLAGYQAHFEDLQGGLFIFTHVHQDCGTSLAIEVRQFTSLTKRPILTQRTMQPKECEELCVREGQFEPCPAACECSWVREIIQTIKNWPKAAA